MAAFNSMPSMPVGPSVDAVHTNGGGLGHHHQHQHQHHHQHAQQQMHQDPSPMQRFDADMGFDNTLLYV